MAARPEDTSDHTSHTPTSDFGPFYFGNRRFPRPTGFPVAHDIDKLLRKNIVPIRESENARPEGPFLTSSTTPMEREKIEKLRVTITENLRVQRGGAEPISYIDIGNVLSDVSARQNHTIFGRRGCGKSLLLHYSAQRLPSSIKSVYLNCEDFKNHSYPGVLIEILDALFGELERHLTGWFGKKKRSRLLVQQIRSQLKEMRTKPDQKKSQVRSKSVSSSTKEAKDAAQLNFEPVLLAMEDKTSELQAREIEEIYQSGESKVRELNSWLPMLKSQIREFFAESSSVKSVYLQIDDFYHLNRVDQPLVIDFIHRVCKDLPLYFKLATLRHASTLYVDKHGQPIGAQERHDYQPINIDFTFADFKKTVSQNRSIFREYGQLAGITIEEIDSLFKGEGFERLVLAGGGVPRDCLSLFLEILPSVQPPERDGKIGKDDVRTLSRSNFERRIEELKQDSEGNEQSTLLSGIYALRQYCVQDKKTNVFLVSESELQNNAKVRALLYRLLDYRIIHSAGSALTHKSQPGGSYHAFMIDAGCYAHMRILDGRLVEIDLNEADAKERMRSAPILEAAIFSQLWRSAPIDIETALVTS